MSEVEVSIRKLETLLGNHSKEALRASTGSEFSYGRACGIYQGLDLALRVLRESLDESDLDSNKPGKKRRSANEPVIHR